MEKDPFVPTDKLHRGLYIGVLLRKHPDHMPEGMYMKATWLWNGGGKVSCMITKVAALRLILR